MENLKWRWFGRQNRFAERSCKPVFQTETAGNKANGNNDPPVHPKKEKMAAKKTTQQEARQHISNMTSFAIDSSDDEDYDDNEMDEVYIS